MYLFTNEEMMTRNSNGESSGRPKSKKSVEKTKNSSNTSIEAVKVTIERKKQCNSRALEIVTNFSEGIISEVSLVNNLQFINQEHYQDIIEERSINKLCGYPLCGNKLKNIPTKQYHISTVHNKVFDITDRKNFCSNLCYKASKYLKDQILTSPLWLREDCPTTEYKLISLQSKGGIAGDEVDLGATAIKAHLGDIYSSDKNSLTELTEIIVPTLSKIKVDNTETVCNSGIPNVYNDKNSDEQSSRCEVSSTINHENDNLNKPFSKALCQNNPDNKDLSRSTEISKVTSFSNERLDSSQTSSNSSNAGLNSEQLVVESTSILNVRNHSVNATFSSDKMILKTTPNESNNTISQKLISNSRKNSSKRKSTKKNVPNHITPLQHVVLKIEQILKEWFSIDSLCFIFGEEKVKDMLSEKKSYITECYKITSTSMDSHVYERYLAICRKLNILELEDLKIDASFKEEVKKPLPNYEVLKEEAKSLDLKVKMFYKGDKLVRFEEPEEEVIKSESGGVVHDPILPLVDLHAQKALRRRIVIDRLRRVLQDLQKSLGLRYFNLNEEVRNLVSTFTLSAHNITMKPIEWNLTAIVIIKLLSLKEKTLEQALNADSNSKHLTLLLMSYSLDSGYLDRLVVWLTDIDSILQKKESP